MTQESIEQYDLLLPKEVFMANATGTCMQPIITPAKYNREMRRGGGGGGGLRRDKSCWHNNKGMCTLHS